MYSQKNKLYAYKQLGTCKGETIKRSGCYMVSFTNLVNELQVSDMNPVEMNAYLTSHGGYVNGCLFNSTKVASLFNMEYAKTKADPNCLCIAETDYWKKVGVPQHFFLYLNGKCVDPLDDPADWKRNKYKIVSYRLFRLKETPKPVEPSKPTEPEIVAPSAISEPTEPSNMDTNTETKEEVIKETQGESILEVIFNLIKQWWTKLKK